MERALSGITPSGKLHLGNYIGAIQQFIKMQDEYEMYVFVSNLHSLTIAQDKKDRKVNTRDLVAFYLASGLDTNKTTIFLQSEVLTHAQLAWIMQCHTYMGELSRMTQYKDKSSKHTENINVGLFTYPDLMAADILIYDPKYVPVGEDQRQHIELARDVAIRFNNKYGDTFHIPEIKITKGGAKIMSLSDPTKKMSKSDDTNDRGCVYLLDDEKTITKKIMSATTDSIGIVQFDEEKQPGISNLLTIYSQMEQIKVSEAAEKFKGYSYADFKEEVAKAVVKFLMELQEKYQYVIDNNLVEKALEQGKEKAYQ
ncbi:tryptophan--tRNA ligase, partial [Erysipelotrichaceae bacterium OttesenSCG-928-M19]|nr:tryptophan--tRNA ligase [Erysipelotrichaceae bacterium OttesenSCG-928-M19]